MSFGEDEQGEVYYTTDGGQIYQFPRSSGEVDHTARASRQSRE